MRWKGDQPIVTDGPFIETKETIGGYAIFEVADLDIAIAIAKCRLRLDAPGDRFVT